MCDGSEMCQCVVVLYNGYGDYEGGGWCCCFVYMWMCPLLSLLKLKFEKKYILGF